MKTIISTLLTVSFAFGFSAQAQSSRVNEAISASEIARTAEIEQAQVELIEAATYLAEMKALLVKQKELDSYDSQRYLAYAHLAAGAIATVSTIAAVKAPKLDKNAKALSAAISFGGGAFTVMGISELANLSKTESARLIRKIETTEKQINELMKELDSLILEGKSQKSAKKSIFKDR